MTFAEGAIHILKQNNNQAMTSKEIWSQIESKSLVKTNGKTPWATLNSFLIIHSKDEYREKNLFKIIGERPMRFCLLDFDVIHLGIEKEVLEDLIKEEENTSKERILLYSITSKELNWKKLSVYNNNDHIEYEVSDCSEYTYIIEDNSHDKIKIGKTKNDPEQRLSSLKTSNPSLNILHVFPAEQYSEEELHKRFDDLHYKLEWFHYTKILKFFLSQEILKHNKIYNAYQKNNEYYDCEKNMLSII